MDRKLSPYQQYQDIFVELSREEAIGTAVAIETRVHHEVTPYQTIEVFKVPGERYLMTIDGYAMVYTDDNFFYHECMSHVPLMSHPHPEHVLIIGGGDCGVLYEVLKHPSVQRVTQIDIDERVTRLSERYFPELCARNDDPRAHLLFADGIQWIQQAPDASLDVVIIDSTDPVGPAQGLFNIAFYEHVRRALKPDGIMIHQSGSPLLHLHFTAEIRRAMLAAGFSHLSPVLYPQPVYTSWWGSTMASMRPLKPQRTSRELDESCRYYNAQIHHACIAMPSQMRRVFQEHHVLTGAST